MARYLALFRGINVGKAKRVAMADLRALLERLGFSDVQTLLNSGNAVFTGPKEPPAKLATRLRAAVATKLGVDALIIIKSAQDVAEVMAGNKLESIATDHSKLLVVMIDDAKSLAASRALTPLDWCAERIHVGKHAAYVWCGNGILESKAIPALFKKIGQAGTSRAWSTMLKINALLTTGGKQS